MKSRFVNKLFTIPFYLFVLINTLRAQEHTTKVAALNNMSSKDEIWDMIGRGISSYEIDVTYIYGELYVAASIPDSMNHTRPSLFDAYLFPLYSSLKKNGNIINGDASTSFIILNIHSEFKKSDARLKSILAPMREMVTYFNDGWHEGKVRIVVRDKNLCEEIRKSGYSCLGIVGSMKDLDNDFDSNQMPLIEVDFSELTSWRGLGNIPFPDFIKIKEVVKKVHLKGRKICITNCPNYKTAWEVLLTSKVDFICTNDPVNVSNYLNERK